MKYLFLFLSSLLLFSNCQQPESDKVIRFKTSPSWHNTFTFELNYTTKELTYIQENTWMYRKNGDDRKVFYELDSNTKKVIRKYGQHEFKITKQISEFDFNKLSSALDYLINHCEESNDLGNDGIGYFVTVTTSDSIRKLDFHNPSPPSKKIKAILNVIDDNFGENVVARFAIENARRYIEGYKNYKILSTEPLYIRLYEDVFCDEKKDKIIDKLPSADTVYIDFTNFTSYDDTCTIKAFEAKYQTVKSIKSPRIWLYGKFIFEYSEVENW